MTGAVLRPVGMLKDYAAGQVEVTLEAGVSVREALSASGIPPELVALVLVNDAYQTKDYLIREGDVVQVFAIIGGG
jgi:sulfur carrier protein ThiS